MIGLVDELGTKFKVIGHNKKSQVARQHGKIKGVTKNRLRPHNLGLSPKANKGHFTHETESPLPIHFKHSHWWKWRIRSKFTSHYAWGTNRVCERKMDIKSTWIPTWHRMDHVLCWTILKNHLLEGGLTQKQEAMALWMLAVVDLFYFNMCEGPYELSFIKIEFGWGSSPLWLHTTLEGPWPHYYMILEVGWDGGLWILSLGLSQLISWSRLLARVWSGP